MTIENPRILLALLALVPIVGLQLRAYLRGQHEIVMLGAQWSPEPTVRLYTVKWFFSTLAFNVFVVFAILAAANITWGERPVEEDRSGLDVVVVIDVSRSMLAADVEPSRLVRSLAIVRSMSRQLPTARVALVAFKGDAITLLPMTEDANALEAVLDGVGPALISTPGTNLEAGLAEALRSFPEASFAHGAVVVLSDGEALTGNIEEPLAVLRRRGIPVLAVVAGTSDGAPVPGGDGMPVTDEDGRPVISRAHVALLADIADRSGGVLLSLSEPDIVADLVDELSRFVSVREREGFRLVPARRFRLFLVVALLALLVSTGVRMVRWRGMF